MKLNINGTLAQAYEEEGQEETCFICSHSTEGKGYIIFDKDGNRIGHTCSQCATKLEADLTDEEWDKAWFGKES
ncbi:hypothetical protein [endosymbiont GvMRE of Glomus versiforme]|uniref:hypothetical protein n=1 Tax=endosymbiont GvMRE of Glomus versiforme TaxID=2039283 RepID=UPI000ECF2975|nr:hypothetical protein [endosymbiont GvMRE of Glomus versiforme]RHZ37169.1 hypothetical protein GvMRE_I1g478 [endosymbiont GvMRE of Glomus versiforme]